IPVRFPYDSIRCLILLQVLLATEGSNSRTGDDCCCRGMTGSKEPVKSLGMGTFDTQEHRTLGPSWTHHPPGGPDVDESRCSSQSIPLVRLYIGHECSPI